MGPAKSYEITNCLFTKSHCTSEGQIVCSNGSEISDVTCRCDYQKGYAMGQTKCCSPTLFEDCTCYKKRCPYENQELDPGKVKHKESLFDGPNAQCGSQFKFSTCSSYFSE